MLENELRGAGAPPKGSPVKAAPSKGWSVSLVFGNQKFWRISVEGKSTESVYGACGTAGQSYGIDHATPAEAEAYARDKIDEKRGKGYVDDVKPLCPYDGKCYRRNPDHWKDERHDKQKGPLVKGAARSTPPPPPSPARPVFVMPSADAFKRQAAFALPVMLGEGAVVDSPAPRSSHWRGRPDLPASFEWPSVELDGQVQSLSLLLQLAVSDVKHSFPIAGQSLPPDGHLCFFAHRVHSSVCRVVWVPTASAPLTHAMAPPHGTIEAKASSVVLSAGSEFDLSAPPGANEFERPGPPGHHLFGRPAPLTVPLSGIQRAAETDHKRDLLGVIGAVDHKAVERWRLLLQVDTVGDGGDAWTWSDRLFFMIRDEDLESYDYHAVQGVVQRSARGLF